MEQDLNTVAALAVAAIAEDAGVDVTCVRIRSLKEKAKSPLDRYLNDRGISYRKYQLGD